MGSSQTVSEALENLARYSRANNEALVVEISRPKDEVTLAIRHVPDFDESHRQFFELLDSVSRVSVRSEPACEVWSGGLR